MPTIIDSLVVELGFDTDGLEAGRKKVEDAFKKTGQSGLKAGKDIENSAKTAGEFMNRLRNNVLSLFAAFTAGRGIKDFVSGMTSSDAALGRFAKTVNMTAKEVATWHAAGALMGVDAKDIDSTISGLTQQFQQFALTGDSTIIPYFRSLGIAMADAKGEMRPFDDLMMDISRHFKEHHTNAARAVAIMNGMNIPASMQNMILQGPEAMEEMKKSAEKLGIALANDVKPSQDRLRAWNDFMNQLTAVGVVILTTVTPALIFLVDVMKGIAVFFQDHPELAGIVFAALAGVVIALTAALSALAVGATFSAIARGFSAIIGLGVDMSVLFAALTEVALPGLANAFLALGLAIEATPVGWIIAGITTISVIGYELIKHWESIAKWWGELWGGMGNDAEDSAKKITDAADKIKDPNKPDEGQPQNKPGDGPPGQGGGPPKKFDGRAQGVGGDSTLEKATNLLKGFEGFSPTAYWDTTAYRVGYGSDTTTDPTTGQVTPVTAETRGVTREQAHADLQRRLRDEFIPMVQKAIGPAWNKLSNDTKAAVVSVSYNYGKVPAPVAAAAQSGNPQAVADAINGLSANRRRRVEEAKVALAGYAPQPPAQSTPRQDAPGGPIAVAKAATPALAPSSAPTGPQQRQGATEVRVAAAKPETAPSPAPKPVPNVGLGDMPRQLAAAPSAPSPAPSAKPPSATQVAVNVAMQRPEASVAPTRASLASSVTNTRGGNYNHQSSETKVGEIKVYTQATDAQSIARDLKPALARDTFAQQANFGPV